MSLTKRRSPRRASVAVTFSLRAPDARSVHVLGEFNDWSLQHPLRAGADGTWSVTVRLPQDVRCQSRYLVDEAAWVTDPDADAHVPNAFGSENGVVAT
jgi:1,4-alpha-glucan branching enzyme